MPDDETSRDDESLKSKDGFTDRKLCEEFTSRIWKPGQSGNPKGRPIKKPVTTLYEEMLQDPEFVDSVREAIVKAVRKGSMAMVLQIKEMTDRVEGKVVQPIDADVSVSTLAERMALAESRLNQK